MSTPASSDLALMRQRPHEARLYLSIYKPPTRWTGQATGTFAHPNMDIDYVGGAGDTGEVEAGMTLRVGTSPGGSEKGRVRVRSIDGSSVGVAENSDILWEVGDYLTILDFFEVWPVFPRYVLDYDELTVTAYKDWDIEHDNQNNDLGSWIKMGPHRAALRDPASGQAQVYWTASGSANLKNEALSYSWEFAGGDPATSSAHTPGYVNYTGTGHYTTKLTVTTTGSVADESYRHVSIYDYPHVGGNAPHTEWGFDDLTGDRETGGYTGRFWVRQPVADLVDGALVVIFGDVRYGDTVAELGGNALNNAQVFFVGYVRGDTITYNYQDSIVEFDVDSVTEIMKNTESFSVSVESKATATTWFELADMNAERAVWHYLRWHSTAMLCTDFAFDAENDQLIQYFDADRESLYDAIHTLMDGTLVGTVAADRQGMVWVETDAPVIINATGTLPVGMSLHPVDWMNEPRLEETQTGVISYLEFGGVAWDGPGNDPDPLIGAAPGDAAGSKGRNERIQGLALEDQDQLNQMVGDAFAWANARFADGQIELAGTYLALDIAPLDSILLNLAEGDTQRGYEFDGKPFTVRSVSWKFDAERKLLLPTINIHEVTSGYSGQTIPIPDAPDADGFEIPPIDVPPIPDPVDGPGPTAIGAGLIGARVDGLATTGCGIDISDGVWAEVRGSYTTGSVTYAKPDELTWIESCDGESFGAWKVPQTAVYLLTIEVKPCVRNGSDQEGFEDGDDFAAGYQVYSSCLSGTLLDSGSHSSDWATMPHNMTDLLMLSYSFVFKATGGTYIRPRVYASGGTNSVDRVRVHTSITLLVVL